MVKTQDPSAVIGGVCQFYCVFTRRRLCEPRLASRQSVDVEWAAPMDCIGSASQ